MYKNKNNRRGPRDRRNNVVAVARQSAMALKSIDEKMTNTENSGVPLVRDVVLPRLKKNKVYTFMDTITSTLTGSGTGEVDGSITWTLSALGNNSSYTGLFDAYRIIGVRVQFLPLDTSSTGNYISTVIDYDDNSSTTSGALLQYDTLKMSPSNQFFERSVIPRAAMGVYSGAFTSFGQTPVNQWIDIASPLVAYYGIKYAIPTTSGTPPAWTCVQTVYVQFKNVR